MWLWPVDITFEGYKRVFSDSSIWIGYKNTIIYTVVGTIIHLMLLLPAAYSLSRNISGRKYILWIILFTMLFSGGLIPTYLVVKNLGMLNTMRSEERRVGKDIKYESIEKQLDKYIEIL